MTNPYNKKEFGELRVGRNYIREVGWRADRAIHVTIPNDFHSTALDLEQAKAARDHLTELIEEIEENLDKPVKTTYSELQPGDLYVYGDPAVLDPPKYIRLTDGRSWSTLTDRINTRQEDPDRAVWIIKRNEED